MPSPITLTQIAKATAEWEDTYILAADVIGVEIMANGYQRYKRGDGVTAWSALPYLDRVYSESDSGGSSGGTCGCEAIPYSQLLTMINEMF